MSRPAGAPRHFYNRNASTPSRVQVKGPPDRHWGKKNLYVCDCCHKAVATWEVDEGVTPMFLACRVEGDPSPDKCQGTMQSQMYPPEPWPGRMTAHLSSVEKNGQVTTVEVEVATPPVTYEWFKPDGRSYRKLPPEMRDHVDRGGLDLRRRSS